MKHIIAHRGNTTGPNPAMENHPDYIQLALDKGYEVEIDVWVINTKVYLGHDVPQYQITLEYLFNPRFWCHAKNFEALSLMIKHKDKIHCFSHESDDHILTSKGIIWAYPGRPIDENTICVMPERCNHNADQLKNCLGICSDFVLQHITIE
jgi:hypothetical protein